MAGVRRSEFTENMKQDMYGYYWESYSEEPTQWDTLFDIVPSSSA